MPDTPKDELARKLARYPKEALSYFDAGLAIASGLHEDVREKVLNEVIGNLRRGSRHLEGSRLRPLTLLTDRESEQLASAYSVFIGLLSEIPATADEFVASATGILFSSEQAAVAKSVADSICVHQEEIRKVVARAQLAGEVLPSFSSLDVVIDFRVRMVDGEVQAGVPVAVVHIDTDVSNQQMWLQFSRADVEETIKKLTKCLGDLELAETFSLRKN